MERFSARNNLVKNENSLNAVSPVVRSRVWSTFSRLEVENHPDMNFRAVGRPVQYSSGMVEKMCGRFGISYSLDCATGFARDHNRIELEDFLDKCDWFRVFDFVEEWIHVAEYHEKDIVYDINEIFEEEAVPYKICEDLIIPITNNLELAEISKAVNQPNPIFNSVVKSLEQSISQFSSRPNPDYNGSITSAITALESLVKIMTNNQFSTLGPCVDHLTDFGIKLPEKLRESIKNLYWYTCDEHGLRHGGMTYSEADLADATFMVVTTSSLINFLIQKYLSIKPIQ
jgi:hypothetical protein